MTYRISDVYHAIADQNRRHILDIVRGQELNVSEIASHFDISRTAVDNHIQILIDTKLVLVEKRGRSRMHRINPAPLEEIWSWMAPYSVFWSENLSRLKSIVEENTDK